MKFIKKFQGTGDLSVIIPSMTTFFWYVPISFMLQKQLAFFSWKFGSPLVTMPKPSLIYDSMMGVC